MFQRLHQVQIKPAPSFVTFARPDIEQSIPARFKQQVEKYGDQLAVKSGNRSLSYTELNRAANRIAHAVIDRLGATEVPVAVFLRHGMSAVVAILGILKAGKCYVPLDPDYPAARLAAILEESQASLLLTDDADSPSALEFVRDADIILSIDSLDSRLATDDPGLSISPDSLAYLFYTSGSTGRPKGVVQNHRNVLHQIMTYTNALLINPDDHVTQLHSHGFSASRLDIFGALLNGAALFPFSLAEEGMDGLARRLVDEEITIVHWVPTAFRHFAGTLDKDTRFPKVRLIVLGSEPLSSQDLELYRRHFSPVSVLVNRYGATEAGNIRWYFLDQQTALRTGPVPVGYAIEDTEVLLLDEVGKQLGKNQIGEIAVKSSYLSPGYWQRPDLTAAAFSSVSGEPDKKIYRTGDMGQLLGDGSLLHLGRKDFQAKIRGYRVELGEVECALLDHPAVTAAVVAVRQDQYENNYLVAYYVTGSTPAPDHSALLNHLRARLPSYMVPAAFVRLEALPLTPNGKLDRNALPEPDPLRLDSETPAAKPTTGVEKTLTQMWSGVLGIAALGIHDNFFDLGGQSLQAMMMLASMASAFKIVVSIREFFEVPTVAQMAELIRSRSEGVAETDLASIVETVESLPDEEVHSLLEKSKKQEPR
jgi:amino acid adenylation domain-containing protein